MSTIGPSFAPGAGCYRPDVQTPTSPTGGIKIQPFPQPGDGPITTQPAPGGDIKIQPFPQPGDGPISGQPVPPSPDLFDRFLTRSRSQQLGNTQASQLESIRNGMQNGSITQEEGAKLLGQQARISDALERAGADGVITAREQAQIRNLQRQASFSNLMAQFNGQKSTQPANGVQLQQLSSIAQGARSGQLTGGETASLLREQAGIARDIGAAQADGQSSITELMNQFSKQLTAAGNIINEKNDTQKAAHARPSFFPIMHF
jgi:hypothetical protein